MLFRSGRVGPFLLGNQSNPGGLKGRGALGEPGRSRRYAPRVRESDALPVMQVEREPTAPSSSRRRAPTTARDRRSLGPLAWRRSRHGTGCRQCRHPARQRRARTPQGATRPRSVGRKMRMRLSSVREIRRCPACSHTAGCNSFERPRDIRSAIVSTPTFRTGLLHVGTAGSISRRDSLSPEISDFRDDERRLREPSFEPRSSDSVLRSSRAALPRGLPAVPAPSSVAATPPRQRPEGPSVPRGRRRTAPTA